MVREAGEQARQLSHGLHPGRLEDQGLPGGLEELASGLDLTFEGSCRFEGIRDIPSLDAETATHLYRLAQEAATNAIKHGEAGQIDIILEKEDGALKLAVTDDGAGFDPGANEEGVGLESMRYRARFMGASLEIRSAPGEGTAVHCEIPRSVSRPRSPSRTAEPMKGGRRSFCAEHRSSNGLSWKWSFADGLLRRWWICGDGETPWPAYHLRGCF